MTATCETTAALSDVTIALDTVADTVELERLWRGLAAECRHSFFTSWPWIGCWLACLPPDICPRVLRAETAGRVVALALFVERRVRRHGVVRSRTLSLHETGYAALDSLRIEHNGLLLAQGREQAIAAAVVRFLDEQPEWDEVFLSGLAPEDPLLMAAESATSAQVVHLSCDPSPYVDLARLTAEGGEYLARLSGNTRSQIRRSMREYEQTGPLAIASAANVDEALHFLDELARLHQELWTQRGAPGAFSSEFFTTFHRTLVRRSFGEGAIQLLQISAGTEAIGYLYNFVAHGEVAFYQSGFAYSDNPKLKPGLVSHALAIEFNRGLGHRLYDFLASEAQYKRSLATDSRDLVWAVLQRPRLQFELERRLKSLKRQVASRGAGESA